MSDNHVDTILNDPNDISTPATSEADKESKPATDAGADGAPKAAAEDTDASADGAEKTAGAAKKPKITVDRRSVLAMAGCGIAGLVIGGFLASWGVTQESIASGRVSIRTTPTKMIVTDRARCSGCQRCEMMCTLKNDSRVCQHIARVRVWDNYNFGAGADTGEGALKNCRFTVEHCKQCEDANCMKYCPVHAIYADEKTGARVVDAERCIGCGMCAQACPWNMPRIDSETSVSTKCISCGRCAEQCPNGAILFVDWQDIAEKVIEQGVLRTATLVQA